ncbi:unnamed protein product, partial [Iphiclides podalirius]
MSVSQPNSIAKQLIKKKFGNMEKKLLFAMTLTLAWRWGETASKGLDYQSDLDSDFAPYTLDEYDFDDFPELRDDDQKGSTHHGDTSDSLPSKVNTTGYERKKTASKDLKSQHSIGDLKKFFKSRGLHDEGDYSDDDAHEISEGLASKAVKVTGNEERKYRKGTKTRGFHSIQHKDEYKKDKEIYGDDETSGFIKKTGNKRIGLAVDTGLGHSQRSFHNDHSKAVQGKQGFYDKGRSRKQNRAYSDYRGFNSYFDSY